MSIRVFIIALLGGVLAAGAAPSQRYAVRITVKGELEKERDSSKNESDKKSTKTKSEKQHYDLEVTVANTGKNAGTFDLEWYFFKRPLESNGDRGDLVVCEKNKTPLAIGGMKRITHPIKSRSLSWSESKSSSSAKTNNNSTKASSNKKISGEVYGGYVLLVRADGEIVAKYSDEKKFLTDEWLDKLNAPVENGSGSGNSSTKKKRKKKK